MPPDNEAKARDAGDLETAVTHFTRLGQAVPDSAIRATAEYDAAAALINLEAWGRASTVLEQFRADYPDSEFADDIAQKLAVTYMETGRTTQAAAEFERIAAAAGNGDDVRLVDLSISLRALRVRSVSIQPGRKLVKNSGNQSIRPEPPMANIPQKTAMKSNFSQ